MDSKSKKKENVRTGGNKSQGTLMNTEDLTECQEVASVKAAKYVLSLSPSSLLREFPLNYKFNSKLTKKQQIAEKLSSEKAALSLARATCDHIVKNNGKYMVKYHYQSNLKGNRLQATEFSIFKLQRKLKQFLAQGKYTDLDICKSYQTLLKRKCDQNILAPATPMLEMYIMNSKEILAENSLVKMDVHAFMLKDKPKTENAFLKKFGKELKAIKTWLWNMDEFPLLKEQAKHNQDAKGYDNYKSSYMAYILMGEENKALQHLIRTQLNAASYKVLCYDGVMTTGDDFSLEAINSEFSDLGITWAIKEMPFDEIPAFEENDYHSIKKRYEETYTYIQRQKQPITSKDRYGCYQCSEATARADALPLGDFFDKWIADPDRQEKQRIDFCPYNPMTPETVDEGVFNTFTEFKTPYDKDFVVKAKNQIFQDYLKTLTNNRDDLIKHVYNWVAHLIQRPQENPKTGLIFTGTTGTGKTSLFKLITALLGEALTSSTSDPNQVFSKNSGDNSLLKNTLLAQLEETKGMEGTVVANRLKEFLSADTINIKTLYNSPYSQTNTVRMIINSNENRPFPFEAAIVRRTTAIWIENSLFPSSWWKNSFYDGLVNNDEALKELYHELLHADISDFTVGECPTPTEQEDNAKEEEKPLKLFFFDEFNHQKVDSMNSGKSEFTNHWKIDAKGLYYMGKHQFLENFKHWLHINGYENYKVSPTSVARETKKLDGITYVQLMKDKVRFRAFIITDKIALANFIKKY